MLNRNEDAAGREIEPELLAIAEAVAAARSEEALPAASPTLRERLERRLLETTPKEVPPSFVDAAGRSARWWHVPTWQLALIGISCCAVIVALLMPDVQSARDSARRMASGNRLIQGAGDQVSIVAGQPTKNLDPANQSLRYQEHAEGINDHFEIGSTPLASAPIATESSPAPTALAVVPVSPVPADPLATAPGDLPIGDAYVPPARFAIAPGGGPPRGPVGGYGSAGGGGYGGYAPVPDANGQTRKPTAMARGGAAKAAPVNPQGIAAGFQPADGRVPAPAAPPAVELSGAAAGPSYPEIVSEVRSRYKAALDAAPVDQLAEVLSREKDPAAAAIELKELKELKELQDDFAREGKSGQVAARPEVERLRQYYYRAKRGEGPGTEQYEPIVENVFLDPRQQPLSTFSIDVDTASYANMRRFLTTGRLPPANAVRIEELVNYFRYDYPQPKGQDAFSVNMEVAECPWKEGHLLLRVGLKGKEVPRTERPASNLVFLLDVSGSMADANKLPLLKTSMQMLVRELGENDRVSIVTYAGEAGLKLAPTRGHEQAKIVSVIESLTAGGSTNGSAGIELAYEQAGAYFVNGGTNRVILCTDGDLNVGVTSDEALVKLIKQKAKSGTFLTVLGFGEGNLKDAKMEKLADNGNGLYAYIDSVREARKVLVEQLTGSTITIAKDVKIQVEFNPAQVTSYRLLGYENRVMAAQDFNNDKKDAGEIGAGHTVTALYELVPVGAEVNEQRPVGVDSLRYQRSEVRGQRSEEGARGSRLGAREEGKLTEAAGSGELLTLKLRYKEPEGETSKLLECPLKDKGHSFHSASPDFQFAAAVVEFGMILRGSEHRGSGNLAAVAEVAAGAIGNDPGGYRAEFLDLVRKAQQVGAK